MTITPVLFFSFFFFFQNLHEFILFFCPHFFPTSSLLPSDHHPHYYPETASKVTSHLESQSSRWVLRRLHHGLPFHSVGSWLHLLLERLICWLPPRPLTPNCTLPRAVLPASSITAGPYLWSPQPCQDIGFDLSCKSQFPTVAEPFYLHLPGAPDFVCVKLRFLEAGAAFSLGDWRQRLGTTDLFKQLRIQSEGTGKPLQVEGG